MFPISRGYGTSGGAAGLILRGFSIGAAPDAPLTLITRGFGGRGPSLIKRGFSSYIGLPEPPIPGKQYQDITSLTFSGFSLLLATPSAVLADVMVNDTQDNSGYNLFLNGDGTGYDDANGDLTRRQFTTDVFSVSGQALIGSSVINLNDNPPQLLTPVPTQFNEPLGGAVALDFVNGTPQYVLDPDGDPLTLSVTSGALPDGLSITGTLISGFTTVPALFPVTLRFADVVGESLSVNTSFLVYPVDIIVPDLTGLSVPAVTTLLVGLGLTFNASSSGQYSDTIPLGNVVDQSVDAGTDVTFGTNITIILSLGSNAFPGFTVWQALSTLANAGFVPYPVIQYVYSSTFPNSFVVATNPPAGSMITSAQGVQLTVSMGPPNPTITSTIPNVVGRTFIFAQGALVAAQCSVSNVSWQISDTVGIARVISQSPAPGGPVTEWTQVSLVVASGPTVTYPNTGALTVPNVVTP